ncbi:MAG TPA: UDP-N-acetylmuramate dehydrogenase [Ilumatobacteraceae bacterium]|nr:UDP-N-acetylmuramate dehydrogenase [Ilumatobacteraceae bacterium]
MTSTKRMTAASITAALGDLGDLARPDVPLADYTTYRLGGPAAIFAIPTGIGALGLIAEVSRRYGLPVLVLGRGSNMLVADGGFGGIVVSLASMPTEMGVEGSTELAVTVDGAAALPVVARRLSSRGIVGFEWAVGVPGSVGGAVRMNAGGHGSDMAEVVSGIHLFDLRRGQHGWVPVERLGLRFRGSDIADHQVVVSATLRLRPGDPTQSEAQLAEIVRWRRQHQPGGRNAGSVFVNPIPGQLSAAELIDGIGLRGLRIGGASVSDKHANFIQADDGATADDVRAVIETVRQRVLEETGFALRSEVRLVGFDDAEIEEQPGVVW